MPRRTTLTLLPLALAGSLLTPTAAQAEDTAPVITGITTENNSGGLTPYIPLFTTVAVTFTDSTPGTEGDYLVRLSGTKQKFQVFATEAPDEFVGQVPADALKPGAKVEYSIVERADGEVVGTSAPEPFTFTHVGHPSYLSTSSTKVDGQWSYRAGTRATLSFKGKWEPGTTIHTQVWVSRTRRFTADDYTFNTRKDGALVQRSGDQPVTSFRVPRKHVGKYVWVSVMGWKDGEGGWIFEIPAERIIRR